MKATALSVKPSQRVLIGGPSDTKFKSPKFDSNPQTPTSPKNYRFFGKPRNITSRGTIHSMPQINKQSSSSSSPAFAVISKSIQETQLWLVDDSDSTNQYREFDGRSTKYSNLEKLLGENRLSAIPEVHGYGRSKASRSTPKGKMNSTGYNKNDTEDLRNLPAFRKIFSRPSNSPQRKYVNTANQGNVEYSPDNFNTEKLVSRAKQRTQTSGGTFRKADTGPSNYYALSAVGYHNYKYPKVTYSSQAKRRNNLLQPQNKETIENCIQNIHNQKMLLENLKNNEEVGSPEKILEDTFWAKSSPGDAAKINLGFQPFKKKLDPIQSDRQSHRIQLGFQGESIPDTSYEGNMILEEKTPSPQKRRIELKSSPGNMEGSVMPLLKKGFSPDLKRIIVNKKQSFNLKQLKMEFEHYSEISQIYLEKCKAQCMDSPKRQNEYHLYQLNNAIKEKGICLHIFFETQDCLKNQKKTIINRILLALGVNLTSEYPIVNLNQFQTLKRIAVSRDLPNTELIDFVIKFFKLEEVHLNKENFLRILRSLTEKVDTNDPQQIAYSDNLYETFIENYKLTGILKDEEHYVDLNRFRQVYLFNKMNILDLTDLITGIN